MKTFAWCCTTWVHQYYINNNNNKICIKWIIARAVYCIRCTMKCDVKSHFLIPQVTINHQSTILTQQQKNKTYDWLKIYLRAGFNSFRMCALPYCSSLFSDRQRVGCKRADVTSTDGQRSSSSRWKSCLNSLWSLLCFSAPAVLPNNVSIKCLFPDAGLLLYSSYYAF